MSDGWTTADLVYIWKEIDPVQIVKDLNLPRFKLEQFQTTYCNTITNTGQSSAPGLYTSIYVAYGTLELVPWSLIPYVRRYLFLSPHINHTKCRLYVHLLHRSKIPPSLPPCNTPLTTYLLLSILINLSGFIVFTPSNVK